MDEDAFQSWVVGEDRLRLAIRWLALVPEPSSELENLLADTFGMSADQVQQLFEIHFQNRAKQK